ncbi:hypothetical protein Ptr902_07873 [Pyrenophora tritici-repentis]|nr:hypothetical protein Ptr902_07873 [Pyrenophora tritici-repentis]
MPGTVLSQLLAQSIGLPQEYSVHAAMPALSPLRNIRN